VGRVTCERIYQGTIDVASISIWLRDPVHDPRDALDAASAEQAYRYVRDAIDTHGGPVMLDVAGLSFCDARGLYALVRVSRYADQAGSSLQLVAPSPRLVKLMRITGLDQELPVHREKRTGEVA
jgi:anti-anti-sigma factor